MRPRVTPRAALLALLAKPVEAGLAHPARPQARAGYRYTQPRDPKRDREAIKRDLGIAYVEWRRQAHKDPSAIVSVRQQSGRAAVIRPAVWRCA